LPVRRKRGGVLLEGGRKEDGGECGRQSLVSDVRPGEKVGQRATTVRGGVVGPGGKKGKKGGHKASVSEGALKKKIEISFAARRKECS